MASHARPPRRRLAPLSLAAGVAGVVALSLSMTGTLSAFTASITNSTNTAAAGTLVMQETGPGTTPAVCTSTGAAGGLSTNAFSCGTINKYGGSTVMVPGTPVSTAITIANTGTIPASGFSLTPGACTQTVPSATTGSATDFCTKLNVTITSGATTVFTGTAAGLAARATNPIALAAPVAPGASVPFTFTVTVDGGVGNTYQGLGASQPLTWTFISNT